MKTYLNFLGKKWWLEVAFDNDLDLHFGTADLTHQWNDSEWQTDVFCSTVPETSQDICQHENFWKQSIWQITSNRDKNTIHVLTLCNLLFVSGFFKIFKTEIRRKCIENTEQHKISLLYVQLCTQIII